MAGVPWRRDDGLGRKGEPRQLVMGCVSADNRRLCQSVDHLGWQDCVCMPILQSTGVELCDAMCVVVNRLSAWGVCM